MPDYPPLPEFDAPPETTSESGAGGPKLPGGLSVQAAATGLLIIVVLAILWLFFGPTSDDPAGLPTPTVAALAGQATPSGQASPSSAGTLEPTPIILNATPPPGDAAATSAPPGGSPATTPLASGTLGAASAGTPPAAGGSLTAGNFAQVVDAEGLGVRFRFGPGLDYATIRIIFDGEQLRVMGGPESADGYTWWRLQDAQGNIGWASQEYLSPTAAPAGWNPPAASPTHEAGSGDTGAADEADDAGAGG